MGHNNYQPTHENVHTGLSGLNNDEKWIDMLNFRCAQGRTTVVPHKARLLRPGCGFHTLVPNGSHTLAIGKCGSVGFVGADNLTPYRLWRLQQEYLGLHSERGEQSQRLQVRGQYTGNKSRKLRVTYIDGKLIPHWMVPEPLADSPTPPETDYGCATAEAVVALKVIVLNALNGEPIDGVQVQMSRYGVLQYDEETNTKGSFYLGEVYNDTYQFVALKETFVTELVDFTINQEYNEITLYMLPITSFSELPCGVSFAYTSGVIVTPFEYNNKRLTWLRTEENPAQYTAVLLLPDEGETAVEDVKFIFVANRVADAWVYSESTDNVDIVISEVEYLTDCSTWPVGEDGPISNTPETISIELYFHEYPPDVFETQEIVELTGSVSSGAFTGTCSKGNISLIWSAVNEVWVLGFDDVVVATGTGLLPNYNPMWGATNPADPNDFYVESGGGQFPNWTASVPAP